MSEVAEAPETAVKTPSPVERAEAMIARAEARLAERAQRKPEVVEAADVVDTTATPTTEPADSAPALPAVERAEDVLDRAGAKIGLWAAALKQQVLKTTALAREEAEDMLAEAQALRHQKP